MIATTTTRKQWHRRGGYTFADDKSGPPEGGTPTRPDSAVANGLAAALESRVYAVRTSSARTPDTFVSNPLPAEQYDIDCDG